MPSPYPVKNASRLGGKLAPNDPKLRITFSMPQRLCSIIIPPRWSAASAGSISALSGGAHPQKLLPAARRRSLLTSFPFLLPFLNPMFLLHLDRRKPIAGFSSNGRTAPGSPSFSRALPRPQSPPSAPAFSTLEPYDSTRSATQDFACLRTGRFQKGHRFARRIV
jgi:hypothetical protein